MKTRHSSLLPYRLAALSLAGSLVLSACDVSVSPDGSRSGAQAGPAATGTQAASSASSATPASTPAVQSAGRTGTGTSATGSTSGSRAGSAEVAGALARPAGASPAAQVYQQAGPSVVNITSLAVVRSQFGAGGQGQQAQQTQQTQPRGTGSGFVIDAQGHIVTNNHVVEDAQQLSVTFPDRTTVPATLVGRDPDNDLAVVRVDPNGTDDNGRPLRDRLKPVAMGDSGRITIGEDAIAIGSPLGLQQTVTLGIVSALRQPGEDSGSRQSLDLLGGAVQTDAAINPGNSGGPLFNAGGEVIGVNTAIFSQSGGSIGIGFAIPINVVKRVVPELINRGCYVHPLVGVSALSLSQMGPALKQQLGIPTNQKGLLVQEASAGAAQAGLRAGTQTVNASGGQLRVGGDIVTEIDGRPLAAGGDLRAYIENNKRPGESVALTVVRDGQPRQLTVALSQRPPAEGVSCR